MSYGKYSKYRRGSRGRSQRGRAWLKHCDNRLRRLEEGKIIADELKAYGTIQETKCIDEQRLLAARNRARNRTRARRRVQQRLRHSPRNHMTWSFASDLLDALENQRHLFYYRRDDYARRLLSYVVGKGQSLRTLRQSPFARLLTKPGLLDLVAKVGNGKLTREHLLNQLGSSQTCYQLTLDLWGFPASRWPEYVQTSRPGLNLVLQVNFNSQHNEPYNRLINPVRFDPFEFSSHPIAESPHHTMAWVRMDIAEDLSHALIEEVQNDWIRFARHRHTWRWQRDETHGKRRWIKEYCNGRGVSAEEWHAYTRVLAPHKSLWAEAALSAAIALLQEEIGIDLIFYHTYEGGNALKGISGNKLPPKSLYTRLPERFCFTKTMGPPPMLEKHVKALCQAKGKPCAPLKFYLLDLSD